MPNLIDAAPGFDEPLAVLKHCHDRIRRQLKTLERMIEHLRDYGADEQVQQAAHSVLRYFQKAAPMHHDDEEQDLLPGLQRVATGEDAQLLQRILPEILQQHQLMADYWLQLEPQLDVLAHQGGSDLNEALVEEFVELYTGHMEIEEQQIAPMARRLFSAEQMAALGAAMQARRGLS